MTESIGEALLWPGRFGSRNVPAWVLAGASVDFDFTNNRSYVVGSGLKDSASPLTVTRASVGYADDTLGNWTSFPSNTPRITNKGLLVEEARTNRVPYSFDFSQASAWALSAITLGTASSADPFGVLPKTLIEDATTASRGLSSAANYSFTSGTVETFFVIAKPEGRSWLRLGVTGTTTPFVAGAKNVWFNLSGAGTVGTVDTGTATIRQIGTSGYYLCAWTFTPDQTTATGILVVRTNTANNETSYAGTNALVATSLSHAQLEQGAFATSPIRTTSAAATRALDLLSLGSLALGSAFSMFAKVGTNPAETTRYILSNSINNRFLYVTGAAGLKAYEGTTVAVTTTTLAALQAGYKGAFATDASGRSLVANGGTVATDALTHPSPTSLGIGVSSASGTGAFQGFIERIALFNSRLTNAQLQTLTSYAPFLLRNGSYVITLGL
jgi:hypothetical protein